MSDRALTILGIAATVAFGVPTWWTLFIEHPETVTFLWAIAPVVIFLLGIFTGWHLRRWRESSETGSEIGTSSAEEVEALGRGLAERDARIAELESDLTNRLTREEVNDLVIEAIREFSEAVARRYDELSRTADDRLRERIDSGEVSGFEARALREVLALDAQPRRWLRSARDEGFVDVEDRVIGDYDRLGHFRNLVTAAETGLTSEWGKPTARYVLNPGVRDVLEEFPEVFELVDRDDEEIARIVSECGGKPYEPDTARYKRVSK